MVNGCLLYANRERKTYGSCVSNRELDIICIRWSTNYKSPLFYYSSPPWVDLNGYSPIPELYSNDSDLFLTFVLMHSISYMKPVDDPLFSAHRSIPELLTDNSTSTRYLADEPVSVFGCQNQVRFCVYDF